MESGLTFNQLICEFESRRPCQHLSPAFMWVVAQFAEHRTVTAAGEGSSPFDPPKILAWNCGRGVRHLIVDQADDGSSPFSSAMRQ